MEGLVEVNAGLFGLRLAPLNNIPVVAIQAAPTPEHDFAATVLVYK
jgi:hypothetical protein